MYTFVHNWIENGNFLERNCGKDSRERGITNVKSPWKIPLIPNFHWVKPRASPSFLLPNVVFFACLEAFLNWEVGWRRGEGPFVRDFSYYICACHRVLDWDKLKKNDSFKIHFKDTMVWKKVMAPAVNCHNIQIWHICARRWFTF